MLRLFTPFPIICVVLLLLAMAPMPYGYYIFLRIVICLWGITAGMRASGTKSGDLASFLSYGIALLYNPIIRIPLPREIWTAANIATILIILVTAAWLNKTGAPAAQPPA